MFLDYFALGLLLFMSTMLIYVFIWIHDLPYKFAKKRNHPQQDAIHAACWLSLFTLHALWPIVFTWAMSNPPPGRTGLTGGGAGPGEEDLDALRRTLMSLQRRVAELEGGRPETTS